VESVLSKFETDDREKEMESLLSANQELLDSNRLLKNQLKEVQPSVATTELVAEM